MRTLSRITCSAIFAVVAITAPAAAQHNENFDWNRALAAGRTIEIKGINGDIKAVGTNGGDVRVHAGKTSKKSDGSQGTIQGVENDIVYLRIADNVKVRLSRSAVTAIVAGDSSPE